MDTFTKLLSFRTLKAKLPRELQSFWILIEQLGNLLNEIHQRHFLMNWIQLSNWQNIQTYLKLELLITFDREFYGQLKVFQNTWGQQFQEVRDFWSRGFFFGQI